MANVFIAIGAFAVLYGAVCLGARRFHRFFVYAPDPAYVTPEEAEADGVEELRLKTADGLTLIAWYAAAQGNKPTLLFFTGNSGSAASHASKVAEIQADGYGVLMLNYRGYGGSEGRPTEAGNVADAVLCYEALRARGIEPEDIVIYGESLGTSVATQLALKKPAEALVLEAPFTSIVAVGRRRWWFLPLKHLMTDQYRTIDYIGAIGLPLLIVHGAEDRVIPLAQAKALYAAAPEPKQIAVFPEAGHNDLYEHGAFAAVDRFLKALPADGRWSAPSGRAREGRAPEKAD